MTTITSPAVSVLAVELLRRSLVLPRTITRIADGEYSGPSGGTVTLAVPVPRAAREQVTPGSEITLDEHDEVPTNVVLRHFYDATAVTDPALTHDIRDFGRQVLRPQIDAVAVRAEGVVADAMNALAAHSSIGWAATSSPDADRATILAVRQELTTRGVPAGNRHLAVAPDIATRLLAIPEFVGSERGTGTALEDATIGRVYGLDVVETASIAPGSAVGYHTSALAYGNPRPAMPSSAGTSGDAGASAAVAVDPESSLAVRTVLAFDLRHLTTVSAVSSFAGAAPVLDGGPPVPLAASGAGMTINTASAHGLAAGEQVRLTDLNGGAGLQADTTYYVADAGLTSTALRLALTPGGDPLTTSSAIVGGTVRATSRCIRAIRVVTAA